MSQIIPIYIPRYISSVTYQPARVTPRLFFYNGQVDCETWYFANETNQGYGQNKFPYFDYYNVVSGSFPTQDSKSLLFNNEAAVYGEVPTQSLYTTYWSKYVSLLYNPKTRLINASAIIPFADYVKLNLNDVIFWRSNYYHLRAINDYSVKTGECSLQLLGPIIPDTFGKSPTPTPPVQASSSVSWSYTETLQDGTFKVYDNATTLATLTANGSGNAQISQSHYVTASLVPVSFPSSGSVTMSINVNGGTTISATAYTNTTLTASFLVGDGQTYGITGSIIYNAPPINYVAGAYVIYDFGNPASYPGTGTTVYDVSGNSGPNASFVGSPTFSSTKGGSLSTNSSNYLSYSGKFPAAYTVQAFYKITSGTSPAYPAIGGQANNNGMKLAIDTGWPSNSGVYQQFWYGSDGLSSTVVNDANAGTNIQSTWTFFSATNDGTNTQTYYVNTTQVSTSGAGRDRTLFTPTNQTVTIGNEGTGELIAWLVYPSVLTGTQITQNYNIFNAR
jgi:hypothetical protein